MSAQNKIAEERLCRSSTLAKIPIDENPANNSSEIQGLTVRPDSEVQKIIDELPENIQNLIYQCRSETCRSVRKLIDDGKMFQTIFKATKESNKKYFKIRNYLGIDKSYDSRSRRAYKYFQELSHPENIDLNAMYILVQTKVSQELREKAIKSASTGTHINLKWVSMNLPNNSRNQYKNNTTKSFRKYIEKVEKIIPTLSRNDLINILEYINDFSILLQNLIDHKK